MSNKKKRYNDILADMTSIFGDVVNEDGSMSFSNSKAKEKIKRQVHNSVFGNDSYDEEDDYDESSNKYVIGICMKKPLPGLKEFSYYETTIFGSTIDEAKNASLCEYGDLILNDETLCDIEFHLWLDVYIDDPESGKELSYKEEMHFDDGSYEIY